MLSFISVNWLYVILCMTTLRNGVIRHHLLPIRNNKMCLYETIKFFTREYYFKVSWESISWSYYDGITCIFFQRLITFTLLLSTKLSKHVYIKDQENMQNNHLTHFLSTVKLCNSKKVFDILFVLDAVGKQLLMDRF